MALSEEQKAAFRDTARRNRQHLAGSTGKWKVLGVPVGLAVFWWTVSNIQRFF